MKIYKANRKGLMNYLLIICLIIPILIYFLDIKTFNEKPFILAPLIIPMVWIIWIYFGTFYKIENGELIYRSGFLRGKIKISTIKVIQKGKAMWSGTKPALAEKGIIIQFNKYDEIYIAPENNDEMITDLLRINSKIIIR